MTPRDSFTVLDALLLIISIFVLLVTVTVLVIDGAFTSTDKVASDGDDIQNKSPRPPIPPQNESIIIPPVTTRPPLPVRTL